MEGKERFLPLTRSTSSRTLVYLNKNSVLSSAVRHPTFVIAPSCFISNVSLPFSLVFRNNNDKGEGKGRLKRERERMLDSSIRKWNSPTTTAGNILLRGGREGRT